jgi:ketosteroid isomerase-like protein
MLKALVLAALLAAPLAAQDSAIDAVRARAHQLEEALTHRDMATLEDIVTDDFLRTPPGGRDTNKQQWLGLVESKRLQYVAFEDSDERFRAYGDTVIINNVSNIHVRATDGAERELKLKLIWVWVKLDGKWKLAAVQGNQVTSAQQ